MHHLNETSGTLALLGSGEFSAGMAEVHRTLMRALNAPVVPAMIDTPAGFELNSPDIVAKATEYFAHNFDLSLTLAPFANALRATPVEMELAMHVLRSANYIFAGPGSPTYAVRNWRGTPVFETMAARLASGAQLVLASAATLAVGRHTLPIYEIYKVGEDPRWESGLDLLGRYSLDLAIVPHWNNNSGGTHDTTRCFVGQARFDQLHAQLPATTVVLGIDEYTACLLSPATQSGRVLGAGKVTIIRDGGLTCFESGAQFDFSHLRSQHESTSRPGASAPAQAAYSAFCEALRAHSPASAVGLFHAMMEMQRTLPESGASSETLREMLAMLAIWLQQHQAVPPATPAHDPARETLLSALGAARANLRSARQFAAADAMRDQLVAAGFEVRDSASGSQIVPPG